MEGKELEETEKEKGKKKLPDFLGDALRTLTIREKLTFFLMFIVILCFGVIDAIASRLFGLWPNKPIHEVVPDFIYQMQYTMHTVGCHGANMTILRLRNGNLALFSPAHPFPPSLDQVSDLSGKVEVIVCPNIFHDSNVKAWSGFFADARVVAPNAIKEHVEKMGISQVISLEEEAERQGWTIVDHSPFLRHIFPDIVVCAEGKGDKKEREEYLISFDTLQNNKAEEGALVWLPMGWNGFRVARFFKFVLVADRSGFRKSIEAAVGEGGRHRLSGVVFSHGPPLLSDEVNSAISSTLSVHLPDRDTGGS